MIKKRDFDLMSEFRKGDPQAFKVIYDTYFPALCYFARRLIFVSSESEEIAADSMVKLFSRYNDFESLQNIRAFLFITTWNSCLNFLAYSERESRKLKHIGKAQPDNPEQLVLTEIIHAEIMREIYKEIEQLPGACREVFELLYLEGKKAKEVAEQLNISINAVWEQRQEAIRLLRTTLLKKGLLILLLTYGSLALVA